MTNSTQVPSADDRRPERRQPLIRLILVVALATFTLAVLAWATAGSAPALASPTTADAGSVSDTWAPDATSVLTIGVAAATDFPFDAIGWPQVNAVQLAISQTNAAGGVQIGGTVYSLTMVTANSACDATQGEAAAHDLVDAGAVAVVGHTCSSATGAAQAVYNAAGVPMVAASADAVALTEQGYTTTFRVWPKMDAPAIELATYFRRTLAIDDVALVHPSGATWAADLIDAFETTLTDLGGTITSSRSVASTDDYTKTLTTVATENPDAVVYVNFDANEAGLLSSVADDLGLETVGWLGADESALSAYAVAAGPGAAGDYVGVLGRSTDQMPGYDALNAAYQAAGFTNAGGEAGATGAFAYDAAGVIIDAMSRAASASPGALRDAIAATAKYEGVVGTYEGFDAQGDVIPQWAWLATYRSGEWVITERHEVFLPLALSDIP